MDIILEEFFLFYFATETFLEFFKLFHCSDPVAHNKDGLNDGESDNENYEPELFVVGVQCCDAGAPDRIDSDCEH